MNRLGNSKYIVQELKRALFYICLMCNLDLLVQNVDFFTWKLDKIRLF